MGSWLKMRFTKLSAFTSLPLLAIALRSSGDAVLQEYSRPEMARKRVAIIGAGAAGASAAYYLEQFAKEAGIPVNITVFERDSYIGGRSTTVKAWDSDKYNIELGASIFVEVNHILNDAAKRFNLEIEADIEADADTPDLGVWNGEELVVTVKRESRWWDNAKLLWRYGMAPIRTDNLMKSTVGKFLRMYDEPIFPWSSLNEVAEEVGLREITGQTGEQFLKANNIDGLFPKEIIQASTRVNYAANIGLIHGLETMVCMAANGGMAIKGGNWKIFQEMLKASKATVHLSTAIKTISKQDNDTYLLTTNDAELAPFDDVILASPYQFADIELEPAPRYLPEKIPYVKLHVTLFATPHKLDPRAFNLKVGEKAPQFVLTTLAPDEDYGASPDGVGKAGFFSVSVVGVGRNLKAGLREENIYKVFSPEPIDSDFLSRVLGHKVPKHEVEEDGAVSWIYRKEWHSYPYEYPRVTFEEIQLDKGLWYTSGIESFISTMETSALMGKNVGRLIVDEWAGVGRTKKEEDAGEKLKVQGQPNWQLQGSRDGGQKPLKAKL